MDMNKTGTFERPEPESSAPQSRENIPESEIIRDLREQIEYLTGDYINLKGKNMKILKRIKEAYDIFMDGIDDGYYMSTKSVECAYKLRELINQTLQGRNN